MFNAKVNSFYNQNDVINSNDLRKQILNVDSRFRTSIRDLSTDFLYRFERPYKNIIRARVASVEIPNMFYTFAARLMNTTFKISAPDISGTMRTIEVKLPDGNYLATDLNDVIQTQLDEKLKIQYGIFIDITIDPNTIKCIFTHSGRAPLPVILGTTSPSDPPTTFNLDFINPKYPNRVYNSGLGFNLGFRNQFYSVETLVDAEPIPVYQIISESCVDVIGDMYIFLAIDEFYAVDQKTDDNFIQCLAKVIVREDKGSVIYDDGSTLLSNDVIFPSPIDLKQIRVKLLDPYGNLIDLNDMNFSFSLEITEVTNLKLYEFYRNYLWLGSMPSLKSDVNGSGAALLGGRGP